MPAHQIAKDWKDKVRGYCPCFTGGDNLFLLNPEEMQTWCECNLFGLKKMLLGYDTPSMVSFAEVLIKSGIFKKKEIIFAIHDIFKNSQVQAEKRYFNARDNLTKAGYRVYVADGGIIKGVYEKKK